MLSLVREPHNHFDSNAIAVLDAEDAMLGVCLYTVHTCYIVLHLLKHPHTFHTTPTLFRAPSFIATCCATTVSHQVFCVCVFVIIASQPRQPCIHACVYTCVCMSGYLPKEWACHLSPLIDGGKLAITGRIKVRRVAVLATRRCLSFL